MGNLQETKSYSVRIKISLPGYRNTFLQGIALAVSPNQAKEMSMKLVFKNVQKKHSNLSEDHITVIKCVKIKDDFFVNHSKPF